MGVFGSRARVCRCLVALALLGAAAGCGSSSSGSSHGRVVAVGAENEYADVIAQIGGKYVTVSAIMSNPNSDPHTFEASPSVAQTVGSAKLVVQNGLGYDDFMDKIESASPSSSRKVIDVQKLLGLPGSTPNPHLWYDPKTMPAVARAVASQLSALQPAHAAYFKANDARFQRSLQPWLTALSEFSARYPGTAVGTTEPVADYMLAAAGIKNLTPFSMQADIMNDTDPPPRTSPCRSRCSPSIGCRCSSTTSRSPTRSPRTSSRAPLMPTFRSSGCTRRCRPAMTTSGG